jgi:hypothetical protein
MKKMSQRSNAAWKECRRRHEGSGDAQVGQLVMLNAMEEV